MKLRYCFSFAQIPLLSLLWILNTHASVGLKTTKLKSLTGCDRDFIFRTNPPNVGPFPVSSKLQCAKFCSTSSTCVAVNVITNPTNGTLFCELFNEGAEGSCAGLVSHNNSRYIEKENPCFFNGYFRNGQCECHSGHYGTLCENTILGCEDGPNHGYTVSAPAQIKPVGITHPLWVFCFYSLGATVIHRRSSLKKGCTTEDFYRTWDEFKTGFGDPNCDYYAGNELIHVLTNAASYVLKPHYKLWGQSSLNVACYTDFTIDDESQNYKMHFGTMIPGSDPVGDGFGTPTTQDMNGQIFCTHDADCFGCAASRKSAWWYNSACSKIDWNTPIGPFQPVLSYFQNMQWEHNGALEDLWEAYLVLDDAC